MRFSAFISYKHAASSRFASELELHVKRFGRSPFAPPLRLFRDEQHLRPGQALGPAIREALEQSRFLILLASPEAAASEWVRDELGIWCDELKRAQRLIVVLTSGSIGLTDGGRRIDWASTTALPRLLEPFLPDAPLWLDARAVTLPETQVLAHDPYFRIVAALSAALQDRDPNEVIGREWQLRRRQLVIAWTVAALLGAGVLALGLLTNRLQDELTSTRSREQAAAAGLLDRGDRLRMAASALRTAETLEATRSLLEALSESPSLIAEEAVSPVAIYTLARSFEGLHMRTDLDRYILRDPHGRYSGGSDVVRALAVSPGGHVWRLSEDQLSTRWHPATTLAEPVTELSADDDRVAWGLPNGEVWTRPAWGQETSRISKHDAPVNSVEVRAGWVVSTALEPTRPLQLWSESTGILVLEDPLFSANAAAIRPGGGAVAVAFEDGHVGVWSLPELEPIDDPYRMPASGSSVAWNDDGSRVAFGDSGGTVHVYEGDLSAQVDTLDAVEGGVWALQWEGADLWTTGSDGFLRRWRPAGWPAHVRRVTAETPATSAVNLDDARCRVKSLLAGPSGCARLADRTPTREARQLPEWPDCPPLLHTASGWRALEDGPAYPDALTVCPDGSVAAVGPEDSYRSVLLVRWDAKGEHLSSEELMTPPVTSIACAADGTIALGGLHNTVTLKRAGMEPLESALVTGAVTDMRFLPDGSLVTLDVDAIRWFGPDLGYRGPLVRMSGANRYADALHASRGARSIRFSDRHDQWYEVRFDAKSLIEAAARVARTNEPAVP